MKQPGVINGTIRSGLFANVAWNSFSQILSRASFLGANVLLARRLGVDHYGPLILSQSVATYIWLLADLGTSVYGIKAVARSRDDLTGVIGPLRSLRVVASGVVFFICATMALLIPLPSSLSVPLIVASSTYLISASLSAEWVLKGLERFDLVAFGAGGFGFCYLLGTLAFVKGQDDSVTAAWVWSASQCAASVVHLRVIRSLKLPMRMNFGVRMWWRHLRESMVFASAGGLSSTYMYLPMLIGGRVLSRQLLSLFSAPYGIVTSLTAPGHYIASACLPRLAESYSRDKSYFSRISRRLRMLLLCSGAVVAGVGWIFSGSIIRLLLGKEYMASETAFSILLWLLPVDFVRYSFTNAFQASDYQSYQVLPFGIGILLLVVAYALMAVTGGTSVAFLAAAILFASCGILASLGVLNARSLGKR